MKDFVDVHDRHCCKRHGCKYGDEDCTVVNGPNKGIECEECYNSPKVTDIFHGDGYFNWQWPGFGFGQLSFSVKNGEISVDAETMSKDRARKILYAFVDKLLDEGEVT